MKFFLPLFVIMMLSVAASASTDIAGPMGFSLGFSGRFPLTGGMGIAPSPPASTCLGVIDATAHCPLPMLGM